MVTTGEASLFVALGSLVASGAYVVSTAQRTPASPRQLAVCVLVQILINLGVSRLNFPWLHVHISEYPRWAWWVTRHSHHHHHHSSSSGSGVLRALLALSSQPARSEGALRNVKSHTHNNTTNNKSICERKTLYTPVPLD